MVTLVFLLMMVCSVGVFLLMMVCSVVVFLLMMVCSVVVFLLMMVCSVVMSLLMISLMVVFLVVLSVMMMFSMVVVFLMLFVIMVFSVMMIPMTMMTMTLSFSMVSMSTMTMPVMMIMAVRVMPRDIIIVQPGVFEESSDDGITDCLHTLLFILVLLLASQLVLLDPLDCLVAGVHDFFLLIGDFPLIQLFIFQGGFDIQTVSLQTHLAFNPLSLCFVVLLKLLSVLNHLLDLVLGET